MERVLLSLIQVGNKCATKHDMWATRSVYFIFGLKHSIKQNTEIEMLNTVFLFSLNQIKKRYEKHSHTSFSLFHIIKENKTKYENQNSNSNNSTAFYLFTYRLNFKIQ